MRKIMNKVAGNMKVTAAKAAMLLKDKKGENYVDTAVKILIAVGYSGNWCPLACRLVCPLR